MKKILLLFISVFLLISCSSAPTPERQHETILIAGEKSKFTKEPFIKIATAFTETAKNIKGFKRQFSSINNEYIEPKIDYDKTVYSEFFIFNNKDSLIEFGSYIQGILLQATENIFPNTEIIKYKNQLAVINKKTKEPEFFLIANIGKTEVLTTEYHVNINIFLYESPFKPEILKW